MDVGGLTVPCRSAEARFDPHGEKIEIDRYGDEPVPGEAFAGLSSGPLSDAV